MDKVYITLPKLELNGNFTENFYNGYYRKKVKPELTDIEWKDLTSTEKQEVKNFINDKKFRRENFAEFEPKFIVPKVNLKDYYIIGKNNVSTLDYLALNKLPQSHLDNLLLDTYFSILTSPKVSEQLLRIGNFSDFVKQSQIISIQNTCSREYLCNLFGINYPQNSLTAQVAAYNKAIDILNSLSSSELKKIYNEEVGEKECLVNFNTQSAIFERMAVGKAMVGIFASANSGHNVAMRGSTKLGKPFKFLGFTIEDIDKSKGDDGKLISYNLAEGIPAATDNGKTPTITDLKIDAQSSNVYNFLLRAGIPIDVALQFMPALNKSYWVRSYVKKLKMQSSLGVELATTTLLNYYGLVNQLTLEDIRYANSLEYVDIETLRKQNPQIFDLLVAINLLGDRLSKYASVVGGLTQYVNFGSVTKAAGPSIASIETQLAKFRDLQEKLEKLGNSKTPVYTNLLDPKLLNTESLSTESIFQEAMNSTTPLAYSSAKLNYVLLGNKLDQFFHFKDIVNVLFDDDRMLGTKNISYISDESLNRLITKYQNAVISFANKGTAFFRKNIAGNNSYEYYIEQFPEIFKDFLNTYKKDIKENIFLNSLVVEKNSSLSYSTIRLNKNTELTKFKRADITNAWLSLLLNSNENIKNMGLELFNYASIYGLGFTGKGSFIHLAPAALKNMIKDFKKSAQADAINAILYNQAMLNSFITQFVSNNTSNKYLITTIKGERIQRKENSNDVTVTYNEAIENEEFNAPFAIKREVSDEDFIFGVKQDDTPVYELTNTTTNSNGSVTATYAPMLILGDGNMEEYYYREVVTEGYFSNLAKKRAEYANKILQENLAKIEKIREENRAAKKARLTNTVDNSKNNTTLASTVNNDEELSDSDLDTPGTDSNSSIDAEFANFDDNIDRLSDFVRKTNFSQEEEMAPEELDIYDELGNSTKLC